MPPEESTVKCPAPGCGARNAAGAKFCGTCGHPLAPPASGGCAPVAKPSEAAPAEAAPVAKPSEAAPAEAAAGVKPPESASGGKSECAEQVPFLFEVRAPEAFCKDRSGTFMLHFRAYEDVFDSVSIALVRDGVEKKSVKMESRPGLEDHRVPLDILPTTSGQAGLTFEIRCHRPGYAADEFEVYSADPRVVTIDAMPMQPLNITVNGGPVHSGQADRAGDSGNATNIQTVNVPAPSYDPNSPRYNIGRVYEPRRFRLKAAPRRLTLCSGNRTLLLLSKERIVFGRGSVSDVRVSRYTAGRYFDPQAWERVSHRHFAISYDNRNAFIADAGSMRGTGFDGEELKEGKVVRIIPGRPHDIVAGCGEKLVKMPAFKVFAYIDGSGVTTGLSIDRDDGVPQKILTVWHPGVPAGSGSDAGMFGWNGSRFQYYRPDGTSVSLVPGMSVEIDGDVYDVQTFNQKY